MESALAVRQKLPSMMAAPLLSVFREKIASNFRGIKPVCALDLFHVSIDRGFIMRSQDNKQSDDALCRSKN